MDNIDDTETFTVDVSQGKHVNTWITCFGENSWWDNDEREYAAQYMNGTVSGFERASLIQDIKNRAWNNYGKTIISLGYRAMNCMYEIYTEYPEVDSHEDWWLHEKGYSDKPHRLRYSGIYGEGFYHMNPNPSLGWSDFYATQVINGLLTNPAFDGAVMDNSQCQTFAEGNLATRGWIPVSVYDSNCVYSGQLSATIDDSLATSVILKNQLDGVTTCNITWMLSGSYNANRVYIYADYFNLNQTSDESNYIMQIQDTATGNILWSGQGYCTGGSWTFFDLTNIPSQGISGVMLTFHGGTGNRPRIYELRCARLMPNKCDYVPSDYLANYPNCIWNSSCFGTQYINNSHWMFQDLVKIRTAMDNNGMTNRLLGGNSGYYAFSLSNGPDSFDFWHNIEAFGKTQKSYWDVWSGYNDPVYDLNLIRAVDGTSGHPGLTYDSHAIFTGGCRMYNPTNPTQEEIDGVHFWAVSNYCQMCLVLKDPAKTYIQFQNDLTSPYVCGSKNIWFSEFNTILGEPVDSLKVFVKQDPLSQTNVGVYMRRFDHVTIGFNVSYNNMTNVEMPIGSGHYYDFTPKEGKIIIEEN